jgi:hypothetical protein
MLADIKEYPSFEMKSLKARADSLSLPILVTTITNNLKQVI